MGYAETERKGNLQSRCMSITTTAVVFLLNVPSCGQLYGFA